MPCPPLDVCLPITHSHMCTTQPALHLCPCPGHHSGCTGSSTGGIRHAGSDASPETGAGKPIWVQLFWRRCRAGCEQRPLRLGLAHRLGSAVIAMEGTRDSLGLTPSCHPSTIHSALQPDSYFIESNTIPILNLAFAGVLGTCLLSCWLIFIVRVYRWVGWDGRMVGQRWGRVRWQHASEPRLQQRPALDHCKAAK